MLATDFRMQGVGQAPTITCWYKEPGSVCLLRAQLAHGKPSVCKQSRELQDRGDVGSSAGGAQFMLFSTEKRRRREGSWWETNKLSIQLLVASNTHGAPDDHGWSFMCATISSPKHFLTTFCCWIFMPESLLFAGEALRQKISQ